MSDAEATIRAFLEDTEDYPESEYNNPLINVKAMRQLCEEYRILFEYAAHMEQILARDYNRNIFIEIKEARERVKEGVAEFKNFPRI